MTTPPTPAGWYPDPDGSGGQRYWDGSAWTEHRSPATPEPAEPTSPAELPGSEQPTAVVPRRPAGEHVGAHRAPDSAQEPAPEPEPPFAGAPLEPPAGEPSAKDPRRGLIIGFGAACAALLAVLVLVVIYGVFIHKDNTIQVSSGPGSTSKAATPTTSSGHGWGSGTETVSESPTTASGSGSQASDGGITFAVTGTETAPSVKSEQAPVEQTAQGEYVIVHMTVLNSGDQPGSFVGMFQKLKAGGTTYSIDDVATAYLNGTAAQLNPGDTSDVAIAFDVPAGTTPESLEVHADPSSAGVEIPLS